MNFQHKSRRIHFEWAPVKQDGLGKRLTSVRERGIKYWKEGSKIVKNFPSPCANNVLTKPLEQNCKHCLINVKENVQEWISDLLFETMLKRLTGEPDGAQSSNPAAPELGAGHVRLWPQSCPHSWACSCLSVYPSVSLSLSPPPTSSPIACSPKGIYTQTHHGQTNPAKVTLAKW